MFVKEPRKNKPLSGTASTHPSSDAPVVPEMDTKEICSEEYHDVYHSLFMNGHSDDVILLISS